MTRDAHRRPAPARAQGDLLVGSARFVAGVFGVAHEIDQDLQDLVFVDGDRRHLAEFALQRDAVAHEGAGVHAQAILDQLVDSDGFGDAAQLGVALLHGHGLLDVLDIIAQRGEFLSAIF